MYFVFPDQQIRIYKPGRGVYKLFRSIHARDVGWSIIDVAFSPDQEHFVYSTWSTACKCADFFVNDSLYFLFFLLFFFLDYVLVNIMISLKEI